MAPLARDNNSGFTTGFTTGTDCGFFTMPDADKLQEMEEFLENGIVKMARLGNVAETVVATNPTFCKARYFSHGRPVYTEQELSEEGWPYPPEPPST